MLDSNQNQNFISKFSHKFRTSFMLNCLVCLLKNQKNNKNAQLHRKILQSKSSLTLLSQIIKSSEVPVITSIRFKVE